MGTVGRRRLSAGVAGRAWRGIAAFAAAHAGLLLVAGALRWSSRQSFTAGFGAESVAFVKATGASLRGSLLPLAPGSSGPQRSPQVERAGHWFWGPRKVKKIHVYNDARFQKRGWKERAKMQKLAREETFEYQRRGMMQWVPPQDGRKAAPDGVNIAVKDEDALAVDPLELATDKFGRNLAALEVKDADLYIVPWSPLDSYGTQTARCCKSWEDLEKRYSEFDPLTIERKKDFGDIDIEKQEYFLQKFTTRKGADDFRVVQTFSWPGEDGKELRGGKPAVIQLIGVESCSARSRKLAGRAVYEASPSALLVQLCRERVGRHLVMPQEHMKTVADYTMGTVAGNAQGFRKDNYYSKSMDIEYSVTRDWFDELAFSIAVDEFAEARASGPLEKVLCLGDSTASRLELIREQKGNKSFAEIPVQSARSKQLVRGLIAMAAMGHGTIMGVVNVEQMPTAVTWLERAGARLIAVADASDIEAGRETIGGDIKMAREAPEQVITMPYQVVLDFGKARIGSFLNQKGMDAIQKRKKLLKKLTRVKDLIKYKPAGGPSIQVAQMLGGVAPLNVPKPGSLVPTKTKEADGWRISHVNDQLQIPDQYLREAGMGRHSQKFWESLVRRGSAVDPRETGLLDYWAAGGVQGSPHEQSTANDDEAWAAWGSAGGAGAGAWGA